MALSINLTLVVQIVHFTVAYFLLSKFLLKPGYEALKSDEERLKQLHGQITDHQEQLSAQREYKKTRWRVCQHYFYQHRPEIKPFEGGIRSREAVDRVPELSPEQRFRTAQEVVDAIKTKVVHD